MSLTLIGVVSTETVAVCVPSAVVSTTFPSSFLPHAASATKKISELASAAARVLVRIEGSPSGFRNGELQSGMYQVRVGNPVGIRCVDLLPLSRIAVKVFGDFAETVAFFYSIVLPAGWRRSRAAGVDVGEVCCPTAR